MVWLKHNKNKFIFTFFLLFSLLSIVFLMNPSTAVIYRGEVSYYYSFKELPKQCACSDIKDVFEIWNTGDLPIIVEIFPQEGIFIVGNNTNSTTKNNTLYNYSFELAPHQGKEVSFYFTIPCKNYKGFSYKINVKINGKLHTIVRDIETAKCQNLILELDKDNFTTDPCEKTSLLLTVRNPAPFLDTYYFEIKSPKGFNVGPTRTYFNLSARSKNKINISISPECGLYGNYSLALYVKSLRNNLKIEKKLSYEIKRNYNFTLDITRDQLCAYQSSERRLIIYNTNNFENNFTIIDLQKSDIINKKFYYLVNSSVLVAPHDWVSLPIYIPPQEPGKKVKVSLAVKSQYGGVEKYINYTYNVSNCYSASIEVVPKPNIITRGILFWKKPEKIIFVPSYNRSIKFYLVNSGNLPVIYNVSLLPAEIGTFQITINNTTYVPNTLYVGLYPGEEQELAVEISPNITGEHEIKLVTLPQVEGFSKTFSEAFKIKIIEDKDVQRPQIINNKFIIRSGTYKEAYLMLRNVGVEATNYTIYSSQSFLLSPLNASVYLSPGEQTKIKLMLNATFLNDNTNLNENVTLTIVSSNGEQYNFTLEIKARATPFLEKLIKNSYNKFILWIKTNQCIFVTIIIIIVIIVLCIIIPYLSKKTMKQQQEDGKKAFLSLALALLIAAIFAGIYLFATNTIMLPKIEKTNISRMHYVVPVGKEIKINLSDYFYDPDNDILNYTLLNVSQGIEFSIKNETLLIIPKKLGNFSFFILAQDTKGGKAISDEFTIRTFQRSNVRILKSFYLMNCWLFNYILFLIVELLILIIGSIILGFKFNFRKTASKSPGSRRKPTRTSSHRKRK